ncbi:AfsR/SARP family transcriptional regulator [Kribbella antiqua]|uniref:AfsR/SARP family transcriptional regulator n=1 Tax=Kribbella antiqua TaxID=2512217 RepID=UPI00104A508F|nr:BTAD domain-containing putative transcriptional regulator [Kribbella antiqua]
MAVCEISLLGGFAVRVDGQAIPEGAWRHTRAAQLVKVLALADGHRLLREQAMELLWPDLDPAAASANLRKALHYARQALGSPASIADHGNQLELFPASVVVDAEVFERNARQALAAHSGYQAVRYPGDLLPEDRYAAWAEDHRDRLRGLHLDLLRAAGLSHDVLAIDPADEEAHRGLMQQALDAGDRSAVVRQFEQLRHRLRADLGVGPDRASITLYEKALALSPGPPPTPGEITQSLLARSLVQLNSGQLEDSARTAGRARALAIAAQLGREAGEASAILGILANLRGEWREAFRVDFEDSVRREPRLASFVFDAHTCLAEFSLCGPNGHEQFAGLAAELASSAQHHRSIQGEAIGELLAGEIALFSGRLDDAHRRLTLALQLYEHAGATSGKVLTIQRLAELAVLDGERGQATRLLYDALPMAHAAWLGPHLVVRTHALLVEANDSVQLIEAADGELQGANVCPPCSLGYLVATSKAFARGGDLTQSQRRLDDAERLAGLWPGGAAHATVWEARAVLRQAHGDFDRARAFWQEAADRFAEVGRPRDRDRCLSAGKDDREGIHH